MKKYLQLNLELDNMNYTPVSGVQGEIFTYSFIKEISPIIQTENDEIISDEITTLGSCKSKIIFKLKLNSKIIDISEIENIKIIAKCNKLFPKNDIFVFDEFLDCFVDSYFKRIEIDEKGKGSEISIISLEIISDDISNFLKDYKESEEISEKISSAEEKLAKKLQKTKKQTTNVPDVKGRKKKEGKD